jgi:hypothetical protein
MEVHSIKLKQTHTTQVSHVAREVADRLKQSLAAGRPVTMKLIVSSLADRLRDEHVLAELVQRSMAGENAFAALTREIVREEAEQIAQAALAAAEPEAA